MESWKGEAALDILVETTSCMHSRVLSCTTCRCASLPGPALQLVTMHLCADNYSKGLSAGLYSYILAQ